MRPRECSETDRQTDAQTQTGLLICPMLCCSYAAITSCIAHGTIQYARTLFGGILGFGYLWFKRWCHIFARRPRFSVKATKFCAYLALFSRSDAGQTDRQTTDVATEVEGCKCAESLIICECVSLGRGVSFTVKRSAEARSEAVNRQSGHHSSVDSTNDRIQRNPSTAGSRKLTRHFSLIIVFKYVPH